MLKRPLEGRRFGMYWHILQTSSAAEIAFNRFVRMFPTQARKYLFAKRPNESEKTIYLTGHREIHFKSGHNFDDLRAETLDGAIIDECRQQSKELWSLVIRPMLGRRKGWCDFYSTPNGFDWFHDLFQEAKKLQDWQVMHAPSTAAWWWDADEVRSSQETMAEPEYAQEILAEFRSLTAGKAYPLFGDHNKARECPFMPGRRYSPYHAIVLGMDFNLSPMSWTLGQLAADRWWWFDEIHLKNSHTLEAAEVLRDKILLMKHEGFQGQPNLIICGDATGKATQRTSNESDFDIVKAVLKDAGISYRDETPDSNPAVKNRVNAVNAKCKNARGETTMWFHPEGCPKAIYDLERVTWKNKTDPVLDEGPQRELTHPSDSIGYPVAALTPIKSVGNIAKMKVISRAR